ncbi:hypothetical protein HYZ80_03775, partial [Candidatus Parcubacteria bacterium]|nr:hypothetical protein [Candidatus Parcubacteria bacterium]
TGSVNDATNLNGARLVFVSGRYDYVVAQTGNRLTVVDVSNPSSPTVVGSVNDATNLNDPYSVFVSGRYAYVAALTGNRLTVVDISNPSSPTVVGSVNDATNLNNPISVFVSGRYAYVSVYTGNRLTVVDISNPSSPTVVGSVNDATNLNLPGGVFVSGRYAYVAGNVGNRLTVVDVSNPASPTVVGSVNDAVNLNRPVSVFVSGRYAYASSSFGDRLTVVDVSTPASPTVVGSVYDATNLDNPQSVFVSGRYAYVAANSSNRLTVVELAGIDVPTVLTGSIQTTTLDTWSFANIGSDLYVRGGIVGGPGGIMTNGGFSVSATTTQTAGGGTFFSINPFPETWPPGTSSVTSTPFIKASSTVTVSNFFAATATSLTSGDFFKLTVPSASFTGDVFKVQTNASTPVNLFRLDNAGSIISSSTATTANFFTASATAITSGDLFRGVLGAPATGNFLSFSQGELANGHRFKLDATGLISASSTATTQNFFTASATAITSGDLFRGVLGAPATGNFLSFSQGELNNNQRFSLNYQGSISASSTVTGTNFFTASSSSITGGDFMKWVVSSTSGFTGDILKIQNDSLTNLFRIGPTANATTTGNFTFNMRNPYLLWVPTTAGDKVSFSSTTTLASLDIGGTWVTKGPQTPNGTPDIAEMIPVAPDVEAFDLVVADPEHPEYVRRTSTSYDPKMLGVITSGGSAITLGNTGFIATGEDVRRMPIVLAGRIPVNVTNENGPIAVGDRLTSSSKLGYAMKATQAGPTVGIALESFGFEKPKTQNPKPKTDSANSPQADPNNQNPNIETGTVLIFLNIGYNAPLTVSAELAANPTANLPVPPDGSTMLSASQNFNGQSIYNLAAVYGLNWRFDEAGRLVVGEVETGKLRVKEAVTFGSNEKRIGITIYDEDTGEPFCIKVKGGELVRAAGECGSPSVPAQPAAPPQPEAPPAPETPAAEPIEPAAPVEPAAPPSSAAIEPAAAPAAPIESPAAAVPAAPEPAPAAETAPTGEPSAAQP